MYLEIVWVKRVLNLEPRVAGGAAVEPGAVLVEPQLGVGSEEGGKKV